MPLVVRLLPLLTLLLLLHLSPATPHPLQPLYLTIVNNCPFQLWPAIQPNAGSPLLACGGFALSTLSYKTFLVPDRPWSGRVWARTHCTMTNSKFSCVTGDCGNRVQCGGAGGATPATLAQVSVHAGGDDIAVYGVSVVDGFNVPMTVTPHRGKGACPVVGCRNNLLETCPANLEFRIPANCGPVVGCMSGCGATGSDELCCRRSYDNSQMCHKSSYSDFYKQACPDTYTYAYDKPGLETSCSGPKELKIIFCH